MRRAALMLSVLVAAVALSGQACRPGSLASDGHDGSPPRVERGDGDSAEDRQDDDCNGDVPGFSMPQKRSNFHLGSVQSVEQRAGFERTIGSDGVFATFLSTGGSLAVSNAHSSILALGPFATSGTANNEAVKTYFIGRGLPVNQVARVAVVSEIAFEEHARERGTPRLNAYASSLVRVVDGFSVADSKATAKLKAGGEIALEQVWWPPFSRRAIRDARAIQSMLSDPHRRETYLASLPTQTKDGVVAVRHSGWHDQPFVVFAAYDVQDGQTRRHFDLYGNEIYLPKETPRMTPMTGHLIPTCATPRSCGTRATKP